MSNEIYIHRIETAEYTNCKFYIIVENYTTSAALFIQRGTEYIHIYQWLKNTKFKKFHLELNELYVLELHPSADSQADFEVKIKAKENSSDREIEIEKIGYSIGQGQFSYYIFFTLV